MGAGEGRGIEGGPPGEAGRGPQSERGTWRPESPERAPTPPEQGSFAPQTPQAPGAPAQTFAIKRSVLRVIGLTVLSFGLYQFYWFNVTRKELSRELGTDDDAALQTAGQLVPILNYVIIYWLWRDINLARLRVGQPEFSIPVYLVLSILGLTPIFYSLVASKLNEYWDRRTGGRATDAPVTRNEKIVVAAGALLWLLWLVFVFVVVLVAATSS